MIANSLASGSTNLTSILPDNKSAVIKSSANILNTKPVPNVNNSDFGTYFVNKLLPHVKSFAYTWFHLQAAKRKHFKNEDKRMNYEDEQQLKQHLMNEQPSVKIKWAVRLLMKLRKDIQKMYQKDLIDIISVFEGDSDADNSRCVVSNPDMKGKMRRIDCLRQSDKVWRLDLVMVVLFKGIPLESSDGERLDKLPECRNPQLCINPNHALLNVRDLEVFLANYINTNNNHNEQIKLNCAKNIASPSVFTPHEFLVLSEVTITEGASENDIKGSMSCTTASANSHYSDDNDEMETFVNVNNINNNTATNNNNQNQNTSTNDDQDEKSLPIVNTIIQFQQGATIPTTTNNPNENIIIVDQLKTEATINISNENLTKTNNTNNNNDDEYFQLQNKLLLNNNTEHLHTNNLILSDDLFATASSLNNVINNGTVITNSNCNNSRNTEGFIKLPISSINTGSTATATVQQNPTPKKKKTKILNESSTVNTSSVTSVQSTSTNGTAPSVLAIPIINKSNIKINELIEQMQQQKQQMQQQQQQQEHQQKQDKSNDKLKDETNKNVINTSDFELRLDPASVNTISPAKPGKNPAAKPRKTTKKESAKLEVAKQQGVNENGVDQPSPAKLTNKRRRSSQVSDTNRSDSQSTAKHPKKQAKISTLTEGSIIILNPSTSVIPDTEITSTNQSTNIHTIEDHSSCSTSSQQDDEIKELLMRKTTNYLPQQQNIIFETSVVPGTTTTTINNIQSDPNKIEPVKIKPKPIQIKPANCISFTIQPQQQPQQQQQQQQQASTKILADELKELLQKEKQTTADLLQLLKVQEDQMIGVVGNSNAQNNTVTYISQNSNSNSNDNIFNELNTANFIQSLSQQQFINNNGNNMNNNNNSNGQQQMKPTTPIFVDQILMSPLFNTFLPGNNISSGSSSSSSSTTGANNQTSLTQFAAAAAAAVAMSTAINLKTPSPSPTVIDSIRQQMTASISQSSFKKTKDNKNKISSGKNNINSSLINAMRFDNSNASFDELLNITNQCSNVNDLQSQQMLINKLVSGSSSASSSTASISPSPMNQRLNKIGSNRNVLSRTGNPTNNGSGSGGMVCVTGSSGAQTPRSDENIEDDDELADEQNRNRDSTSTSCSSPPPPPSIGTNVLQSSSSISAPSPTKLPQFYPYAHTSSGQIMHRPIPILQKANDSTISSILNNLSSQNDTKKDNNTLNANNNANSNNNNPNSTNNSNSTLVKTPSSCDLSELLKLNQQQQQQQQQLLNSLRSSSITNNSPLMFNMNLNCNNSNSSMNSNAGNNFISSFQSNSNIFSNYPNISPANGMNGTLIGGNGSGSPTSNLFPSITSLFQSPIGTPRVTPTPQHFAAYLFNDDQFHSLIFPPSSLSNGSNGALGAGQSCSDAFLDAVLLSTSNNASNSQNMLTNFSNNNNNTNNNDLSPLPLFNNLISNLNNSLNNSATTANNPITNSTNTTPVINTSNSTNSQNENKSSNILLLN